MTKLMIALATGVALSSLPPAYAQEDRPTAPRTEQQGESVSLRALGLDPAQFGLADTGLPQGPTGRRGSSTLPGALPGAPPSPSQPGRPGSPGTPPGGSR